MLYFYKMYIFVLSQLSVPYQWQSEVFDPVVEPLSHYYIHFINIFFGICTTDLLLDMKQSTASQSWKCHPTLETVTIYLCSIIFGYMKSIYEKLLSDPIKTWFSYLKKIHAQLFDYRKQTTIMSITMLTLICIYWLPYIW